jgi:hypothetical protein
MVLQSDVAVRDVIIAAGATGLSGAVRISGAKMMAIYMPASWEAAGITFQGGISQSDSFQDIYDDAGVEVSITAAASRCISLASVAVKLSPYEWIKLRSGVTATPVNQVTAKTLKLILKM